MSSDDSSLPRPPRVPVTAEWLAECRAKSAAYEEERRRYTQAWHRRLAGLEDEPEPEEAPEPERIPEPQRGKGRRSRARGTIHDPRQRRFDF
jgi:hypothetical protein